AARRRRRHRAGPARARRRGLRRRRARAQAAVARRRLPREDRRAPRGRRRGARARAAARSGMTASVVALAQRALRHVLRKPQFVAQLVVLPTLFLAVNTGGLERTTALPGFPHVDGFLDFQLAAAITQSLMLGGVSAGIAVALDIEGGFFDRLVASPTPR